MDSQVARLTTALADHDTIDGEHGAGARWKSGIGAPGGVQRQRTDYISPMSTLVDAIRSKPRPNHRLYLQILRGMRPEARLSKAFELSDLSKQLFIHGLRRRFPSLSEEEFRKLLLARLDKCHNRIY